MKKLFIISAAIFAVIVFSIGCSNDSTSQDIDKLTLGTGLGPGVVTGNGDIFTISPDADGVLIYFKLESKRDMGGGNMISILVEQKIGETWIELRLFDYGLTDDTPTFYYLGSFFHSFSLGTFRATGFLGNRRIAWTTYIVR